jgi:DnaJ homolog subfamily C member 9
LYLIVCNTGSIEEIEDIKDAYLKTGGSIAEIMNHIPHSTQDDEARFIVLISDLISKRAMPSLPAWESSVKDEKARLVRKKQGDKEAKEAEQLAKELGVWDEFYGSGKVGDRRSKGKGSSSSKKDGQGEEDTSALQALILNKKKNMDSFFDSLAVKYSEPESKVKIKNGKIKKRNGTGEVDEFESQSPKKRRGQIPSPPEIDDEEFEKLQQKLFNDKPRSTAHASGSKSGRSGRSRKAK